MRTRFSKLEQCRLATSRQAGMTLVEVVVALVVTGLAIVGIIRGYHYCTHSAQKAALIQAANAQAMERLEETRSAMWDVSAPTPVDMVIASNFPTKTVTLDLSGSGAIATIASLQTIISQISTNPPLKRIRVNCIWKYRGGPFITNSIETLRAPNQ